MPYLVPPLRDAVVLLLQVLAEDLRLALAPLSLVLSGHHLLQLRVGKLVLLPKEKK